MNFLLKKCIRFFSLAISSSEDDDVNMTVKLVQISLSSLLSIHFMHFLSLTLPIFGMHITIEISKNVNGIAEVQKCPLNSYAFLSNILLHCNFIRSLETNTHRERELQFYFWFRGISIKWKCYTVVECIPSYTLQFVRCNISHIFYYSFGFPPYQ